MYTPIWIDRVEEIEAIRSRIDREWEDEVRKIHQIIIHFGWTVPEYLLAMDEAMHLMKEEDGPIPWESITLYKDRKDRAYHTAMSWLLEETETETQGEEQ